MLQQSHCGTREANGPTWEENEMHITETELKGVFLIEPERVEDERGFFATTGG